MRSEERAGIISLILLFLWGTLLTEPLRAFMTVFTSVINKLLLKFGRSIDGKLGSIIFLVILLVLVVGTLLLSKTRAGVYIPVIYFVTISFVYFIQCVVASSYSIKAIIAFSVMLVLIALFHVLRFENGLIWLADICAYTPTVFIVTGLVFIPLRKLIGTYGKIFYITRYQDVDLAKSFDGFLHLPQLVWGVFFVIVIMLPIIYFSFSRTRRT